VTRAERGFTLLELLIALAIVGALLVVAFGGMRVALGAWRQGEDRAEAHQHVRGVTLALLRTVSAAYPYRASRGEAPDPVVLFDGRESRLEFVTASAPMPFETPIAFAAIVVTVGESSERPGLVIRQRALPNRDPFGEATAVFHDPAITSLQLRYLDETGAWQDTWDGRELGLPRAIRIALGATLDGRQEVLPPLTVSLRLGAEP